VFRGHCTSLKYLTFCLCFSYFNCITPLKQNLRHYIKCTYTKTQKRSRGRIFRRLMFLKLMNTNIIILLLFCIHYQTFAGHFSPSISIDFYRLRDVCSNSVRITTYNEQSGQCEWCGTQPFIICHADDLGKNFKQTQNNKYKEREREV
jgi:hypothetical protein